MSIGTALIQKAYATMPPPKLPPKEIEIIQHLIAIAFNCTTTVSYASPNGGSWNAIVGGSCFFVNTGETTILVTAKHVFDEYIKFRDANPGTRLQVNNTQFDLEDRLIDRGDNHDIATFRISEAEISRLGKTTSHFWPARPAFIDQRILFAGFPGKERQPFSDDSYLAGIFVATKRVRTATRDQIATQFEHDDLIDVSGKGKLPEAGYDIGGMSGGPLFAIVEEPVLRLELAGVIVEGQPLLELGGVDKADSQIS